MVIRNAILESKSPTLKPPYIVPMNNLSHNFKTIEKKHGKIVCTEDTKTNYFSVHKTFKNNHMFRTC